VHERLAQLKRKARADAARGLTLGRIATVLMIMTLLSIALPLAFMIADPLINSQNYPATLINNYNLVIATGFIILLAIGIYVVIVSASMGSAFARSQDETMQELRRGGLAILTANDDLRRSLVEKLNRMSFVGAGMAEQQMSLEQHLRFCAVHKRNLLKLHTDSRGPGTFSLR